MTYPAAVRRAAVAAYLEADESTPTISARTGVNARTIRDWVVAAGHAMRPRGQRHPRTRKLQGNAAGLLRAGWCCQCVAAELDLDWRTVRAIAREAGVAIRPGGGHRSATPPPCLLAARRRKREAELERKARAQQRRGAKPKAGPVADKWARDWQALVDELTARGLPQRDAEERAAARLARGIA